MDYVLASAAALLAAGLAVLVSRSIAARHLAEARGAMASELAAKRAARDRIACSAAGVASEGETSSTSTRPALESCSIRREP